MTVMEFFGCGLLAFGPPLAMFIITIAKDPVRIIILMSSAFFWLLSLLFSSLIWFAVVPLRSDLAFGMVFSVLLQELFRFLLYKLLRLAENGLKKVTDNDQVVTNPHIMAYVCGLGFGMMSGAFSLVNVLADAVGPGTMGLRGHSSFFFLVSAVLTLCFILLHTFWGVISFSALDRRQYLQLAFVLVSHLALSSLTLLNASQLYAATVVPAVVLTLVTGYGALLITGGSGDRLLACLRPRPTQLQVPAPPPPDRE
ncbi:gamma-secretase subunit Aph-1-like [Pollicipes pollicipes]|uniref:gamma-secretase subunit Aph-1-like n=1 Tax=Pollicipes pollicipes TaxID=41117 RepID=UPI001884B1B3|nr:gamma-secretase subunit Aph-1-like [Pollicipes pollicipes]XP_037082734.1 gamma-secretase subunit Aph-1-like [Pollicipes pollicipes]